MKNDNFAHPRVRKIFSIETFSCLEPARQLTVTRARHVINIARIIVRNLSWVPHATISAILTQDVLSGRLIFTVISAKLIVQLRQKNNVLYVLHEFYYPFFPMSRNIKHFFVFFK